MKRLLTTLAITILLAGNADAQTAITFNSPDDAVKGLVAAVRANDQATIDRIFAPNGGKLRSGDPVQENEERNIFVGLADDKTQLVKVDDTKYSVEFGTDGWSFPVPIVKRGDQWAFDSNEGMRELLLRRVGRNELDTMLVCAAYAVAQWDYFLDDDWNNDGVREFAQKLVSSSGQKDGLYWPTTAGEDPSPLGPLAAMARAEGYRATRDTTGAVNPAPFHGYYLRVLKAQGPNAPGGRYSYVINGRMISGFALVAYPAVYGSSGVVTFIVNQQGKIHQKDLGPNTEQIARSMSVYNPDGTWEAVDYQAALASQP
jgi:Protein of unknown function (DUF2950)